KVSRRFRLRDLQALVDVADADLPGHEQAEDAQPRRVGERLEHRLHLEYLPCHIYALPNILHPMTTLQDAVREKYGAITSSVRSASGTAACCGPTACGSGDPIASNLYTDAETRALPDTAVAASLGCGNPTALIELEPGQTVLDLGSGGGIDVLLSAEGGGPAGTRPAGGCDEKVVWPAAAYEAPRR